MVIGAPESRMKVRAGVALPVSACRRMVFWVSSKWVETRYSLLSVPVPVSSSAAVGAARVPGDSALLLPAPAVSSQAPSAMATALRILVGAAASAPGRPMVAVAGKVTSAAGAGYRASLVRLILAA